MQARHPLRGSPSALFRYLMPERDFLLMAFGTVYPPNVDFFFQHKAAFNGQNLLDRRNDCCIAFFAHNWHCIDPSINRDRLNLDALTRQVLVNQGLAFMRTH
jgi:hypothetical protein